MFFLQFMMPKQKIKTLIILILMISAGMILFKRVFEQDANHINPTWNLPRKSWNPGRKAYIGNNISYVPDSTPKVYTFINNKWKLTDICQPYFKYKTGFKTARFSSDAGTIDIFVHTSDGISAVIARDGAFELDTINTIIKKLKEDPSLNLIDIGTHVGQHCLAAILIGRHCIGVDAAKSSIAHVCASADRLNFGNNITLIHNIISDTHEKRNFRYSSKGDFGSIHVDSDGIWSKMKETYPNYFNLNTVQQDSVKLDDILKLPQMSKFKKVFIKMDVEGHEHRVLLGAHNFFRATDVRGIIMEWTWHKGRSTAEIIKSFMRTLNFKPYSKLNTPLEKDHSDLWPADILWLPR